MSPFKGQGANQGLIDGLKLARLMSKVEDWGDGGEVGGMLGEFEREMQGRAGVKVEKSREAAKFLHTDVVLEEGDVTRGGMEGLKREDLKRKL
jgi:2-polyprenyl-6-methoxyphenol hydroxylase-like FAD-dependent oxidoreductase